MVAAGVTDALHSCRLQRTPALLLDVSQQLTGGRCLCEGERLVGHARGAVQVFAREQVVAATAGLNRAIAAHDWIGCL